ncbi:MAG TPA: ATP-binding cassette domain-containing protein [Acidimicrobiales bacterium]|nr:ATP-binding cassette domain-containing protein [Acidimicrobiales bacterium]
MRDGLVARALRREARAAVGALGAGLGVGLATLGLSGTSAWLIVRAAQQPAVLSLTVPMGLVQLFALAKAAGRYLERTATHGVVLTVMTHVRQRVAEIVEPLVPAGLGPRSADVVDLAVRDVEAAEDLLASVAGPLAASAGAGVVTALVCGLVFGPAGLALLVALVADLALWPLLARRGLRRADDELDASRAQISRLAADAATGWEEFAMGGASAPLAARLALLEAEVDAAEARRRRLRALIEGLFVATAGAASVAILLASAHARSRGLNPALVAVPVLLGLAALDMAAEAADALVDSGPQRAATGRFDSLAATPWPIRDPATRIPDVDDASSLAARDVRVVRGRPILTDAAISLRAGDVVVLEGRSGVGKTTLAHVLAKFLAPDAGAITLDGHPYDALAADQVRCHVGFAEESPYMFAASVGANVRVARPEATDDEVERALGDAALATWRAGLAAGLATTLGGESAGLSGGEQRRVGLAREYLARRRIIIADEPTEGLDDDTARRVLGHLADIDAAVLLISHRERDLAVATRRVELVEGRVTERVSEPGNQTSHQIVERRRAIAEGWFAR